jgi:hypothetical protein
MTHIRLGDANVDLAALAVEIEEAGVPIQALGTHEDYLATYTPDGMLLFDWPEEHAQIIQEVIAAHEAPESPDFISDEELDSIEEMVTGLKLKSGTEADKLAKIVLAQNNLLRRMRRL